MGFWYVYTRERIVPKLPPAGYIGLIGTGDFFMERMLQQQEYETCGR